MQARNVVVSSEAPYCPPHPHIDRALGGHRGIVCGRGYTQLPGRLSVQGVAPTPRPSVASTATRVKHLTSILASARRRGGGVDDGEERVRQSSNSMAVAGPAARRPSCGPSQQISKSDPFEGMQAFRQIHEHPTANQVPDNDLREPRRAAGKAGSHPFRAGRLHARNRTSARLAGEQWRSSLVVRPLVCRNVSRPRSGGRLTQACAPPWGQSASLIGAAFTAEP